MSITILAICFFCIAVLYSTVGFGGGSSYITILLLTNLTILDIRFIALICNIIVVSTSCWYFYKAGLLKIEKITPLILLSVPFAFLAGMIKPETDIYRSVASVALILAALFMVIDLKSKEIKNISKPMLTGVGGGIGLLSGFIGIGGGIFLSPVLHLIKWDSAKYISAAASFFILVNSVAGLLGHLLTDFSFDWKQGLILGLSVFVGSRLGNQLNIHILSHERIKLLSAILIAFVGIRILFTQLS